MAHCVSPTPRGFQSSSQAALPTYLAWANLGPGGLLVLYEQCSQQGYRPVFQLQETIRSVCLDDDLWHGGMIQVSGHHATGFRAFWHQVLHRHAGEYRIVWSGIACVRQPARFGDIHCYGGVSWRDGLNRVLQYTTGYGRMDPAGQAILEESLGVECF